MSKAPAETHSNRQDGVANAVKHLVDGILKAKKGEPRLSVVRVIEPAQQIAPTSYLGPALKQIGKHTKKQSESESDSSSATETSSDDSDSESDPSNSSSLSSSSETTTSSDSIQP